MGGDKNTPDAQPEGKAVEKDKVQEADEESFPASDPPATSPVVGTGRRKPGQVDKSDGS